MIDETKLSNMIVDLKILEIYLDENEWKDEDKVLEYNELQEDILTYLKEIL